MKKEDINILLIDDSGTMRVLQRKFLESAGFKKIHEADSGQSALQKLKELEDQFPHLIICDWNMEPINGLDFLKRVKAHQEEKYNKVPIVMVTCEVERGQVELAFKEGAVNYIAKPFTKETLIDKILYTLEKQGFTLDD